MDLEAAADTRLYSMMRIETDNDQKPVSKAVKMRVASAQCRKKRRTRCKRCNERVKLIKIARRMRKYA
ncbi:predicted hydroxylase [Pseudozyma hubeiensis SY62]|uniref:Predicted hydroxylase n=1 Tax=Pseudozyma hubeiensis (strain SY62) TaxID=1305764 RepID=R9P826_PSEHS|nr:predicted hydroxylase [Pseudozyma hubeiensis SY62]GAC97387.1 predicted hydroxylase [Pseudozyma hubeiensis SY62]